MWLIGVVCQLHQKSKFSSVDGHIMFQGTIRIYQLAVTSEIVKCCCSCLYCVSSAVVNYSRFLQGIAASGYHITYMRASSCRLLSFQLPLLRVRSLADHKLCKHDRSMIWGRFTVWWMLRRVQLCHGKLSVRLSVTLRYDDHIGWNTSKIISWLISQGLRCLQSPTSWVCCKGNTTKF